MLLLHPQLLAGLHHPLRPLGCVMPRRQLHFGAAIEAHQVDAVAANVLTRDVQVAIVAEGVAAYDLASLLGNRVKD